MESFWHENLTSCQTADTAVAEIQFSRGVQRRGKVVKFPAGFTHRFISADGVDLSPKHDCSEDQKEETFKAEEDEEDDSCWWREAAALWKEREFFFLC